MTRTHAESLATWAYHQLALAALRRVLEVLEKGGVPVLVVKGMVLAYALYDDVAARPLSDVDLRVRPRHFVRAVRALRASGLEAGWSSLQLGAVSFDVDGVLVEIETSIGPPGLCALSVGRVFERSRERVLPGGLRVREPELHDHALVLVVNAFKDKMTECPRWSLDDLETIGGRVDPALFLARVAEARARALTWLAADWMARERQSVTWRGLRDRMGARPPRRLYALAMRRAMARTAPLARSPRAVADCLRFAGAARLGARGGRGRSDAVVARAEALSPGFRMRILFLSQYFPPEPGAPAARVSELARAWVRQGHEVTVLTAMPNHPTGIVPPEYRGRALVREARDGVDVVRTWIYAAANKGRVRRSLGYASFALSAVLWGQLHTRRPDVVIATSPQLLCAAAGRLAAAAHGVPFVFEVRDLWPESIVAVGALAAGHPLVRALTHVEEALYRAADAIVVVTDAFRTRLAERGIDARKIAVIKNGVDLARFVPAPRDTALRARLGWQDKFVAGYVGTHGMAHGLDAVLDAAKRLGGRDDIRLLFVGEGAERARLEARAQAEGIANVRFLGVLPRDAMNEAYATLDVTLVTLRRTELFTSVIPSKIFEIAAMARPILLSVDGEARGIVEASGGGLFVPPEDAGAMSDAIARLADDRAAGERMGAAGRRYVVREFDREVLARRYAEVLERVVAER